MDHNIPPPLPAPTFPFGEMAIGDSFLVPKSQTNRARQEAVKFKWFIRSAKHPSQGPTIEGWDYTSRSEAAGLRVWRTA
jgi:hypothetical protein